MLVIKNKHKEVTPKRETVRSAVLGAQGCREISSLMKKMKISEKRGVHADTLSTLTQPLSEM